MSSKKKLENARSGEIWVINDKKTNGHKTEITSNNKRDRKKGVVKHIPITHAPKTRGMKNIKLQENPDVKNKDKDSRPSYILPKVQKSKGAAKAKRKENIKIKNPIDKSIKRHIKKESKRK